MTNFEIPENPENKNLNENLESFNNPDFLNFLTKNNPEILKRLAETEFEKAELEKKVKEKMCKLFTRDQLNPYFA